MNIADSILLFSFVGLLGLCWGSFLNAIACRLLYDLPILRMRSHCPHCDRIIAWYDLIPIFSWLILKGKCRQCKGSISMLYPLIEILTALVMLLIFFHIYEDAIIYQQLLSISMYSLNDLSYFVFISRFFSYMTLFSLLIIATRTDLESMLIPGHLIWIGLPIGLSASIFGYTETTFSSSLLGIFAGAGLFWLISFLYKKIKGQEGLGLGDIELIALIGSFLGVIGVWTTIIIASLVGTATGLIYCTFAKKSYAVRIPFGPFLALGALLFVLFRTEILINFFNNI